MRGSKLRLFVEHPLAPGIDLRLEGSQAHYLSHVMRLSAGDAVQLFNGSDGEWQARIATAGRGACIVQVETALRPQREEPGPWLIFAPLKKAALDIVVEKAVELGAEQLLPITTRFTGVQRLNPDRLRAQTIEAAEQCGRLTIPAIEPLRTLDAVLADWPATRPLLLMDERGGGAPIADAAAILRDAGAGLPQPAILIGPEGGFAGEEAAAIARRPFVTLVDLGPRILRAETAAIAALACWQAFAGDWRETQQDES